MAQQRRDQDAGANHGPPRIHQKVECGRRSLERNEQEAVCRQVTDHEGEQDKGTDDAEVAPQRREIPTPPRAFRTFNRDQAVSRHDEFSRLAAPAFIEIDSWASLFPPRANQRVRGGISLPPRQAWLFEHLAVNSVNESACGRVLVTWTCPMRETCGVTS